MSKIEDGGPAFPCHADIVPSKDGDYAGMSLRQYAAIKLCVPDSGTDWLDEMIRKSLRNKFAQKVLPACYTEFYRGADDEDFAGDWRSRIMKASYRISDAMLQEGQNAEGSE